MGLHESMEPVAHALESGAHDFRLVCISGWYSLKTSYYVERETRRHFACAEAENHEIVSAETTTAIT